MDSTPTARLASLALLILLPAAAAAQGDGGPSAAEVAAAANDGALGFGYVANAPEVLVGGTVWGLIPGLRGWGLYLDVKMDPTDKSTDAFFDGSVTAAQVEVLHPNDEEVDQDETWLSANAAVAYSVTRELIAYAGAGYSNRDVYRRYLDPDQQRGQFGFYWAADEEASGPAVNFLGGLLLRASPRLRLQFGVESAPVGLTVGGSVMLGGW